MNEMRRLLNVVIERQDTVVAAASNKSSMVAAVIKAIKQHAGSNPIEVAAAVAMDVSVEAVDANESAALQDDAPVAVSARAVEETEPEAVGLIDESIEATDVPDILAHTAVEMAPIDELPQAARTPANSLNTIGRQVFMKDKMPSSFVDLVQQWRLNGYSSCVSILVRKQMTINNRNRNFMFGKWLYLYNHVKFRCGYSPEREGIRSFPENVTVLAADAAMLQAATQADLLRGVNSMDKSFKQLKAVEKEMGTISRRKRERGI
jgi:hypothetical protein